jgi:hypothetical protein
MYSEKFKQIMFFYFAMAFIIPFMVPLFNKSIGQKRVGDIYAMMSIIAVGMWFTYGRKMVK